MTTYSTITDGQIDQDSPITQPLLTALRDNPIAIAEGAAGAPSILAGIASNTTAGGVGSYAFAGSLVDVDFGSTVAGSSIYPTSAATGASNAGTNSGENTFLFTPALSLSGTWRCLGRQDATTSDTGGGSWRGASLFIRVS